MLVGPQMKRGISGLTKLTRRQVPNREIFSVNILEVLLALPKTETLNI